MQMARGRSNQLTKQVGEYLVACELARRGLLVATFSGNVPDFDLIATDLKPIFYSVSGFLINFPHGCDSKRSYVVPTKACYFFDSIGRER
jgi:hypothetical protein